MKKYSEKLLDPRWQRKRLEIFQRDKFQCVYCCADDKTLHVHHLEYVGEPWEAPNESLLTVCLECHDDEHLNRKEYERVLALTLAQKKFSAGSILDIALGFSKMTPFNSPDVMACVLQYVLSSHDIMVSLHEMYFDNLSKNRKKDNDEAEG